MAQADYFLKLDGIDGESEDSQLSGHIQLIDWRWRQANSGSWAFNSGGGSGRVQMGDFECTMPVSKATSKLFISCATGEHIKKAKLVCRKAGAGQQSFLEIELENCLISSYDLTGHNDQLDGAPAPTLLPVEKLALSFEKITVTYKPQNANGSTGAAQTAGFDVKTNQKS